MQQMCSTREHRASVIEVGAAGLDLAWRARCACSWVGSWVPTEREARIDFVHHRWITEPVGASLDELADEILG